MKRVDHFLRNRTPERLPSTPGMAELAADGEAAPPDAGSTDPVGTEAAPAEEKPSAEAPAAEAPVAAPAAVDVS